MGGSGSFFGAMDNFHAVDQWVANLNSLIANSVQVGFKAKRTSFQGGVTSRDPYKSLQRQIGEQLHNRQEVWDWSQGDIVSSTSEWHAAVKGQGMFMVAKTLNVGDTVYYTRNGEFHKDASGRLRTKEGYYLLRMGDVDVTNPVNPNQVITGAVGCYDFSPFSISLQQRGGDSDVFTDGIDTNVWNVTGAPVVDAAGIHIDNATTEGISTKNTYTGSGTFQVRMRFDQFPTVLSASSDYAFGLTGGGANAPHILITDGGYPGGTFNDTDGAGNADGPYAYYGSPHFGSKMPPGPLAVNGTPYHGSPVTVHLFKPGSMTDGTFHDYKIIWTASTSEFYFDGAKVAWSQLGDTGTSSIDFLFNANPGNPTAVTLESFSFVNNSPITVNGMLPGYKLELRDRKGAIVGTATAGPSGSVTLPTTILSPLPYTGFSMYVYDGTGALVGSQTSTDPIGMAGGDIYNVNLFTFAKFGLRDDMEYASIGEQYFDAGTMLANFDLPEANGMGRLIRSALEAANVTLEGLTPELALAKQTYDALTKVLQARISNLDQLLAIVK